MADKSARALLTDREREILSRDADVSDEYYYVVVARVRKRIQRIGDDVDYLDQHDSLGDEFRSEVCD